LKNRFDIFRESLHSFTLIELAARDSIWLCPGILTFYTFGERKWQQS